ESPPPRSPEGLLGLRSQFHRKAAHYALPSSILRPCLQAGLVYHQSIRLTKIEHSLHQKIQQAFYSILDEVSQAVSSMIIKTFKPHLFQQQTDAKTGDNFSALSSLAGSHPKITASALKSAGVPPSLAKPSHVSTASSASKHLNGIGSKVGQLSGKFSNHFANSENEPTPPSNPSAKPSSFNMNKFTGPSSEPSSSVFFWIIWTRSGSLILDLFSIKQQSATPPISNQNSFAPPPTRRVAPSSAAPSYSQPPPPPARTKPQEDEELVEALYDYEGTSPEDLSFKEHQIIKVTEHSFVISPYSPPRPFSDDWWNGQINNGPIGMFPSSYVKPI
ncbi:hypothetical protein VP01_914g4, partial [Puccinia sorghi]